MKAGGARIRLATEDDAPACLAIYRPVVLDSVISFELEPPSREEMRRRIRSTLERTPWLLAEDAATVWGYAYAGPFRARPAYQWTTETTVYVQAGHRGKGVGKALYAALLGILRAAGYRSAMGGFRPVGSFKAAGFKFGAWYDVGFWQLELSSDEAPVGPPRSLAALVGTPEWDAALDDGADAVSRP